ncbi:Quinolinate phosphoribosyltransferase [decarboxylating] [hydrothermal vent metagenome]|uniref:Probable nicotinate-nucleotide pyrophosphorylase [carboxylating] n=1 Tax=hydrothermal vent metagenome TaxID=652676 RepID=A0A3B0UCH4_9ZZZZ
MPHLNRRPSNAHPATLVRPQIDRLVLRALSEDLGLAGDVTSMAILPPEASAFAAMNVRENGIIAGLGVAEAAFELVGDGLSFKSLVSDGERVKKGQQIATISGNARLIMAAERVALNFLCHLSGIASHTGRFVDAIAGSAAQICDTRKTTPNLRALEKYAVRCGGGANHRFGLDDAILIKDNHIAISGGVSEAIRAARAFAGHLVMIEVEVDNIDQLEQALKAGAGAVLLDNMDVATLSEAVRINRGRAKLEASGGVDLKKVTAIAKTGVDMISTSKITMAATPLDIGLDIEISAK